MNIAAHCTRLSLALLLAAGLAACGKKAAEEPPAPSAPPVAAPSGDLHTFSIGTLSAAALHDGGLDLPNDNSVFGVGLRPLDVAGVLGPAGLPTDKLSLSVQPLLVKSGDRVLLFDTGSGMGTGAGTLMQALAEAGVPPATVTDIFISHLHGDHVGGLVDAAGAAAFPSATIHISRAEWNYLTGLSPDVARANLIADHAALVAAMRPKVAAFEAGSEIIPGVVTAVDVKGHTPGHSAYLIGMGQDSLLYVGDSMHHFVVSVQKPEWHIAFDSDPAVGAASRADLLAQLAANRQRIYAVHFPFPGIGRIERRDRSFTWVPE
jgi:glyoxylase-like metal-dependent hydrolase (beta-lactamase superfamily II)